MRSHAEFQLHIMFLTLDIDPTTPTIKICSTQHKITNRDNIKTFAHKCQMKVCSKFHLPTVLQGHAMTLTLIGQCPMSNSSELFSYTTICSSFKLVD